MSSLIQIERFVKAEQKWEEGYLMNKKFHTELIQRILDKSPCRDRIEYLGTFLIAEKHPKDFPFSLIKPNSAAIRRSLPRTCSNKTAIYFFVSITPAKELYWNVAFSTREFKHILFFDPMIGTSTYHEDSRGFPMQLRVLIASSFGWKLGLWIPFRRPQHYWIPGSVFTDRFNHTWTLMFLDVCTNGDLSLFLTLPFHLVQTAIVKTWCFSLLSDLGVHERLLAPGKSLESFPYLLRFLTDDDKIYAPSDNFAVLPRKDELYLVSLPPLDSKNLIEEFWGGLSFRDISPFDFLHFFEYDS